MSVELPAGYSLVPLDHCHKDEALRVLAQLTTVGQVSQDQFSQFVSLTQSDQSGYHTHVILDSNSQLVGIGTLLVEQKLIHGASKVGHIEDIAIDGSQRGKGLGKVLITHLIELGVSQGCYKVILDCSEENVGFYERCGLKKAGIEMDFRP